MPIIVKQITTRPTTQDLYWFEHREINFDNIKNHLIEFNNCAINILLNGIVCDYDAAIKEKTQLRPDIATLMDDDLRNLLYDPTKLEHISVLTFNNLEEYRQANRKYFDATYELYLESFKITNNKIREEVYDEDGNFIEYGLFNIE